jgi:hypothetical protein
VNAENPYSPSESTNGNAPSGLRPSNRAMWRAYFYAPIVAPLAFVTIVFIAGYLSVLLGGDVNEASMIVLPGIALTVGVVSCYLVAGFIGMPIAFFLRRIDSLNAFTIHTAAFGWALFFTTICAIYMVSGTWTDLPLAICYVGAGVIPSVVLSGTAFWLLVRFFSRREAAANA